MMPIWFQTIRWIHILCGMLALFVGPIAMATLKGGPTHRKAGKIYFWMMAVVAVTAMAMALVRPIFFLAYLAVFAFYFCFLGYRALFIREHGSNAADWIAVLLLAMGSTGLTVLGLTGRLRVTAPIVSLAFGLIGLVTVVASLRNLLLPSKDKMSWWYQHMGGMLGGYIGTLSAFSAVNLSFLPTAVRWLWPSAIGLPVVLLWVAYYQRKFTRRVRVQSREAGLALQN